MAGKELRSLEQKLGWLATVSCSVAALGIDGNNYARLPVIDLQERWDKRYKDELRTAFTIWMDCRFFAGAVGVQFHSGEHSISIQSMARQHKFRTWLEQCHNAYTYCMRIVRPNDTMKIVCFCRDGQWNSVACARILANILCPGADPFHKQHSAWVDQDICVGNCDKCETKPRNEPKKNALAMCEHMWASFFNLTNQCLPKYVPPEERVSGSILDPAQRIEVVHV